MPCMRFFTIDYGKTRNQVAISIQDMSGKTVLSKSYAGTSKTVIDMTTQAKGNYIIRINMDGQIITAKLIIER